MKNKNYQATLKINMLQFLCSMIYTAYFIFKEFLMKKKLLWGAIAVAMLFSNAFAITPANDLPSKSMYYTGWGQSDKTADKFIQMSNDAAFAQPGSRIDQLLLSFFRWDGLGNIKEDGGFVYTTDSWKSNAYKELRKIYTASHDGTITGKPVKMIASFGGFTYAGMWDSIMDNATREIIAQNIVALMGDKIGKFWDGYRDLEGISIDGIDLDFERTIRISPRLNDALFELIKRIRQLQQDDAFLSEIGVSKDKVKDDIIILTTYHIGADPVECATNTNLGPDDGCSFPIAERVKHAVHAGELTRLLKKLQGTDLVDSYNLMLYDAGHEKDFYPAVAIDNYLKYVPANRLNGGVSVKAQWALEGPFVKTQSQNAAMINLYKSKNLHGYFTWSLGGGGVGTPSEDIDKHYYLAKVWENVISDASQYQTAEFTPSDKVYDIPTKSELGVDHHIVTRDGKSYVVYGKLWFEIGHKNSFVRYEPKWVNVGALRDVWGESAANKIIVVELFDRETGTLIKRITTKPRDWGRWWTTSWVYPGLTALLIQRFRDPGVTAGMRFGWNNRIYAVTGRWGNHIWLKDLTKEVRVYAIDIIKPEAPQLIEE